MTDYHERIRQRIESSGGETSGPTNEIHSSQSTDPTVRYELPMPDPAPRQTMADVLVSGARPILYEALGRTFRSEREHGFAVFSEPQRTEPFGKLQVSNIQEGRARAITGAPRSPSASLVGFDIHTHPIPGNAGFSFEDYTSMAADLLQHPPVHQDFRTRNNARSSFGVITQRHGDNERGVAVLSLVTTTQKVNELSIDQQRGRTQELAQQAEEMAMLATVEDVLEPVDDLLTHEFREFEVPEDIQSLKFRSAIPPETTGRRFGNAFADGDLTDVLDGVRYL